MKKSTINFIINATMFLAMSAIAGIGFLIKYTLVPGQERQIKYGSNVALSLFGMDRHEWGNAHLIISFIFIGLLALHLILHYKVIKGVYNRIVKQKILKNTVAFVFIIIAIFLLLIPFIIQPKVDKINTEQGQHSSYNVNRDSTSHNSVYKISHVNVMYVTQLT